jgi:hypothetical protein
MVTRDSKLRGGDLSYEGRLCAIAQCGPRLPAAGWHCAWAAISRAYFWAFVVAVGVFGASMGRQSRCCRCRMVPRTAAGVAAAVGLRARPRSSAPAGSGRPMAARAQPRSLLNNFQRGAGSKPHRTREAGGRRPAADAAEGKPRDWKEFNPHDSPSVLPAYAQCGRVPHIATSASRAPPSPDSLANQEIEKEGLARRLGRGRRRRGGRASRCFRRALAGRRRHRTVVFFAQGGARRISRRGAGPGGRRRVEWTLPTASCEPERCGHDGHQGEPHC